MKRNTTRAERLYAAKLDAAGVEFKHQMILGFYILDFCIPNKMLNIEIDGPSHDTPKQKQYDQRRDEFVARCGYTVIRIKNDDVETTEANSILDWPDYDLPTFRSSLAKANSLMSKAKHELNTVQLTEGKEKQ